MNTHLKKVTDNRVRLKQSLLHALFLLVAVSNSFAATKTSAGTGNWNTAATWSPSGAPTSGDDVVIASGHVITVDSAFVCNNLTIGNATNANATVQITSASNSLTINGDLKINPSSKAKTYVLDAGPGTINIAGTFGTWASAGLNSITVGTGTINFSPAITISNNKQNITFTGAGIVNFLSSFTDQYNKLVTSSGCTVNFSNSYIVNTTAATWAGNGTANFANGANITATSNLTLNNVTINNAAAVTINSAAGTLIVGGALTLSSGSTLTTNQNFEVGGSWTNNGGTFSGSSNTVTFNGSSNTIGGTGSTTFGTVQIGRTAGSTAVSYSMDNDNTFAYLVMNGSTVARNLSLAAGKILTVSNDVIMNQSTGAVTSTLAVNAGTCNVSGNLTFSGTNATTTRVAKIDVTSGTFALTGSVTWMSNTAVATEVITVSTGMITFGSSLTMGSASGTLAVTSTGTINFNGSSAPSLTFGGATAPVLTTTNGCTLNFANGFTNNTAALTLAAASQTNIAGNGTITPTTAITFGHLTVNAATTATLASGAAVIVAGDFTLASGSTCTANQNFEVGGNWVNNGGTFSGSSYTVTFNGASNTIGGTSSTTFGTVQIGRTGGSTAVSYTINDHHTLGYLVMDGSTAARTLAIASGKTLTISNDLTLNQPTAASITTLLEVGSGTCNVSGNLVFSGTNATATRVAKVNITSGTFALTGSVTWMANTVSETEVITVSTGIVTFGSSLTMGSASGTLEVTGTGTINFNGSSAPSFTFGGATTPVFTTTSGCTVNLAKGITVNTNQLILAAGSQTNISGSGTITPSASITFGNLNVIASFTATLATGGSVVIAGDVTINSGATFTANQSFQVDGNWVNNGGTFTGSSETVTFNGATGTIGGTSSTTFRTIQIGKSAGSSAVSCTINTDITANYIVLSGSSGARTFALASGKTLTVNNNVTLEQPTGASTTTLLGVNEGTCNVSGNLIFSGTSLTTSKVAKIAVTSGTFYLAGGVTWMANTVSQTEVITVSTGTVTFGTSITMGTASGTIEVTGTGTINFNGTSTPSLLFGGSTAPALNTASGCTVHFEKGFTNSTTPVTFASGANITVGSVSSSTDLTVDPGTTITNNGSTVVYGQLVSASASNFINGAGATLEIKGSVSANVSINASAVGNTVKYNGSAEQTVKGASYYNLALENAGTKTLGNGITIANNLTVGGASTIATTAAQTVAGTFTYASSGNSTLSHNLTTNGFVISSGVLNDGGNSITVNGAGGWINNGGNFTTNGTVHFTGGAAQTIGGSAATAFRTLNINNPGGVTLNVTPAAPTVVATALQLNDGIVHTTAANVLRLLDNATASNGSNSSYVEGPMVKVGNDDFDFPVGKDGRWRRVGVSGLSDNTTEISAEYFFSGYSSLTPVSGDILSVSTEQYWMIDRTVTSDPVKIRLFWEGPSYIGNCDELKIAHWKGTQWEEEPSSIVAPSYCNNNGSGSIQTVAGVTSFSPFTFGDGGGSLPIELVSFEAEPKGNTVKAKWITSTEIDNDYFTLEKSADGVNFTKVTQVDGAGNSTSLLRYESYDENPLPGLSYYRLKQTDFDGAFAYSAIVAVRMDGEVESTFSIYPNPTSDVLHLVVSNPKDEIKVIIYDLTGREMYANTFETSGSVSNQVVNIQAKYLLPAGVYMLSATTNGKQYKEKLILN